MKKKMIVLLLGVIPFLTGYTLEDINKDTNLSVTVWDVDVPVYDVEVSWGNMEFVYNEVVNYEWNSNTLTYELGSPVYNWISSGNDVNITNKSPYLITIDLIYNSVNSNINGKFDVSNKELNKGESFLSRLSLSGQLSKDNTNYIKVGTVDMVIS